MSRVGRSHSSPDVQDDDGDPPPPAYLDNFELGKPSCLALSADLSETLWTDDIDVIDVHRHSPPLIRSVFENGVLLTGSERLWGQLDSDNGWERSPRERLDEALRLIDDHLA